MPLLSMLRINTQPGPHGSRETHIVDGWALRGRFPEEEHVEVTVAVRWDEPEKVGIGWSHVAGVDVHPELLAEALRQLGYKVTNPGTETP